jgi:hypothetical protein
MTNSDARTMLGKRHTARAIVLLCLTLVWSALPVMNLSAAAANNRIDMIPTITSINIQDGRLIASGAATSMVNGKIHTVPFSTTLNIALDPSGVGAICPVLDLQLGPIDLNLLGLVVKTSPICIDITAYEDGGLLGSLFCALGGRMAAGQPLEHILAGESYGRLPGLTRQQVSDLRAGLKTVLNEALRHIDEAVGTAVTVRPPCDILHLELGPIRLDLLGLVVTVDDCAGGPVIIDITGEQGLLGALLCGLLGQTPGVGQTLAQLLERTSSQ